MQANKFLRYEATIDFHSLFEADTFDKEEVLGPNFVGFVKDEAGILHVAAVFIGDTEGQGGWGYWDSRLV